MHQQLRKAWLLRRFFLLGQRILLPFNSFRKLIEQTVPCFLLVDLRAINLFYKLKNQKLKELNLTKIFIIKETHWLIAWKKKRNMICKLKLIRRHLMEVVLSKGIKVSWKIHDYKLIIDSLQIILMISDFQLSQDKLYSIIHNILWTLKRRRF